MSNGLEDTSRDGKPRLAGQSLSQPPAPTSIVVSKPDRQTVSLSARILILTVAFIAIGEILIFIPSIARFRLTYLEERVAASYIAILPGMRETRLIPDAETADHLLKQAGVAAITLRNPDPQLMFGAHQDPVAVFDLEDATPFGLIVDAFVTLMNNGDRVIQVTAPAGMEGDVELDIQLGERVLWQEMRDYGIRILSLTLVLSLIVGLLIFLSLRWMIVAPLKELTGHIASFRDQPENDTLDMQPSSRRDEIGIVEQALLDMQVGVRQSLRQKTRLAGLGEAVSKISHDLRNILSTAVLISDRLENSPDPQVQKDAPRLVDSLNRAIRLSAATVEYAKSGLPALDLRPTNLTALIDQAVVDTIAGREGIGVDWETRTEVHIWADSDQLSRAFGNLLINAAEAMPGGGRIIISMQSGTGWIVVRIADQGDGIPEQLRPRLFDPFAGSSKPHGSGLGLAISREILRAHGGDISLVGTGAGGTIFEINIPRRQRRNTAA